MSVYERQKILLEKKLCFNCIGIRYCVDECKSKLRCQICDWKYYMFICYKQENKINLFFVVIGILIGNVIYLVVVVEVEGIKCCVLLDMGVGSLYVFVVFLDCILSIKYKREI